VADTDTTDLGDVVQVDTQPGGRGGREGGREGGNKRGTGDGEESMEPGEREG